MWKKFYSTLLTPHIDDEVVNQYLASVKSELPTPVFWLLGKTQSGKTSLIRALTGDSRAQIGNGMQPCTQTAYLYDFPDSSDCIIRFLDTRGLGEVDYEPGPDIEMFREQTHVLIVVVKAMDHAQQAVLDAVRTIHKVKPEWPIIVVQTALHEGYPDVDFEHPVPYPFDRDDWAEKVPSDLGRSLLEQRKLFKGLDAHFVPVDLTRAEDGYRPCHYGLEAFWRSLESVYPSGIASMLHEMKQVRKQILDIYSQSAHPHIIAYSLIAGIAGAAPLPFVDIPLVTLVQIKMFHTVASLYNYPLNRQRWGEISGALGVTLLTNVGRRELIKLIPGYGLVVSSLLTAATTYALGKTLCVYFQTLHRGNEFSEELLQSVYREQFEQGRHLLKDYINELRQQVSTK